jgi:hypothetical protein
MTGKSRRKLERAWKRNGLPRGTVTETWYQREARLNRRDAWVLVVALAVSALALAVLK